MKKIAILIACLTVVTSCVACSDKDATPTNERTQQANTSTINMITGDVSITGKVTQIYGNELLLRLAQTTESTTQTSGRGEMSSSEETSQRPNMTEMTDEDKSAMRENMTEMTDEDKSAMRENMTEMTDEDKSAMRENMTNADGTTTQRGQKNTSEVALSSYKVQSESDYTLGDNWVTAMSIGITSFIKNGGPSADRSSMTDADREAMMSQMGDRTSITGGATSTNTDDIVLTNDIEEYLIPVGTPVYSMGTALSFSQISKDAYITIYMNREGNILSVNILG